MRSSLARSTISHARVPSFLPPGTHVGIASGDTERSSIADSIPDASDSPRIWILSLVLFRTIVLIADHIALNT